MPIYTYECGHCRARFDRLEPMNSPARTKQCKCGGKAKRVIEPCSVRFVGPGFHVNDYDAYGPKKLGGGE